MIGDMDLMSAILSGGQQVATAAVRKVRFSSQISPTIEYEPGAQAPPPREPGVGDWFMRNVVRPSLEVDLLGYGPMTFEPYGPPERNLVPYVAVGLGLGLVGAVTAIGWAARRIG